MRRADDRLCVLRRGTVRPLRSFVLAMGPASGWRELEPRGAQRLCTEDWPSGHGLRRNDSVSAMPVIADTGINRLCVCDRGSSAPIRVVSSFAYPSIKNISVLIAAAAPSQAARPDSESGRARASPRLRCFDTRRRRPLPASMGDSMHLSTNGSGLAMQESWATVPSSQCCQTSSLDF